MPLHIIRQDITQLECDAIVNAANSTLLGGGGVDGAIHSAAGSGLLEECKTLGGCDTGDAKITKGYNLPCKYVIHTVGPIWNGGKSGEKTLLKSCYEKSLALAKEHGCETIAFPLISAGAYKYPKDEAVSIAVECISRFLFDNEMTVYLTVFDKTTYKISEELFSCVAEYIDDNYADESSKKFHRVRKSVSNLVNTVDDYNNLTDDESFYFDGRLSLEDMLSNMDECFSVTLLKLIDIKGISEVECYKKANVSKQTWYKILNEKNYKPSKNTVIAFAIALQLTLEETKSLLSTVGFTLSKSSKFDIIIEYFIINGEYDIFLINETLFKFDQVCLGV